MIDRRSLDDRLRDPALIEAAVREAARQAVLEHRLRGAPLVEWRDGKVVYTDPNTIDLGPGDLDSAGPDAEKIGP